MLGLERAGFARFFLAAHASLEIVKSADTMTNKQ
jgi:hypothetical protein